MQYDCFLNTRPDLIFIGITIVICVTTCKLTNISNIDKLLSFHVSKPIINGIQILAGVGILVMLANEIGHLMREWGYSCGPLGYFHFFVDSPIVGYFLYILNITLASFAFWEILKAQEFRSTEADSLEIRRVNLVVIWFFINLMFILTTIQSMFWEVICFFSGIVIFLFLSISWIIVGRIHGSFLSKINEPLDELKHWNTLLLLFVMVFLQTMITKAGILLIIILYTRQKFSCFISFLLKRPFDIADNKVPQIKDLANRISVNNKPALLGFYFLSASAFTMLIFFQLQINPFSGMAVYPKAGTISLIYTFDILFICCAMLRRRFTRLTVLIACVLLIITRYLLPVITPSFFINSQIPHYFNTVEALSYMAGPWTVPLVGIILQLYVFTFLMLQSKLLVFEQAIFINNKIHQLKDLGIATILMELYAITPQLLIGYLFTTIILLSPPPVGFEGQEAVFILTKCGGIFIMLVIFGFSVKAGNFYRWQKKENCVDELFFKIKEWNGTKGIDKMLFACPLLASFGLWREGNGRDWLLLIHQMEENLLFGGAMLILFMGIMEAVSQSFQNI